MCMYHIVRSIISTLAHPVSPTLDRPHPQVTNYKRQDVRVDQRSIRTALGRFSLIWRAAGLSLCDVIETFIEVNICPYSSLTLLHEFGVNWFSVLFSVEREISVKNTTVKPEQFQWISRAENPPDPHSALLLILLLTPVGTHVLAQEKSHSVPTSCLI